MYSPDDYKIPERPLEPRSRRCLECAECGGGIYSGEQSVVWDGERLCLDCAAERASEELDTERFRHMIDLFAGAFGFTRKEVYAVG